MQTIDQCVLCGDGRIIDDPQTGDGRCQNCGIRPAADPPLVGGGQGHPSPGWEDSVFTSGFWLGAACGALVASLIAWVLQ